MIRTLAATLFVASLASIAWADHVVLTDGRTFSGTVTEDGQTVIVELSYATLHFPRSEVAYIDRRPTAEEELDARLEQIRRDNIEALHKASRWAREEGLTQRAAEIAEKILKLDPDHEGARSLLGYVQVDHKWVDFAKGMELARSRLAGEQYEELIEEVLPKLRRLAESTEHRRAVADLLGRAQLQAGRFEGARETFESLAESAPEPESVRYEAIAGILSSYPDGMYTVAEAYPPSAALLRSSSSTRDQVQPGPASLRRPIVLSAALRDQAKEAIAEGAELMGEAREDEPTEPDAARVKYAKALKAFDRADTLVPDIARTYRVEITRRRINSLRGEVEADAEEFDKLSASLGAEAMTSREYQQMILRMLHRLNNIRDSLKEILILIGPYERELYLESKWAQADLRKTESMRRALSEELREE
jgi:tetratricopeptide (TPR) repeat protein